MTKNENKNQEKDLASVSYVPFLCLIALYRRKDSEFIQFHAKQGTAIFVLIIAAYIIGQLGGIFHLIEKIAYILLLSTIVIGFSTASRGEKHEITFISDIVKTGWNFEKIFEKIKDLFSYVIDLVSGLFRNKKEENFEETLKKDVEKLKEEEKKKIKNEQFQKNSHKR